MTSSVSVVDLAGLSQGVFTGKSSNIPDGYQLNPGLNQTVGAMTAQTFESNGNIVVVFTGTDKQASNYSQQLAADRQLVENDPNVQSALSPAAAYLQDIAARFPGSNITVTGYSWGGTEAAYAQQQLQANDAERGTSLAANVSTVAFNAAAVPADLVPNAAAVNAINVASYADPAIAVTEYLGNKFPGQTVYVNTGVNPDGITQGIIDGTTQIALGTARVAVGVATENAFQAVQGAGSIVTGADTYTGAINTALDQGHDIGLLKTALSNQEQAKNGTLTADQVQGDPSLTPLVTQIQGSTVIGAELTIAQTISQWATRVGLGSNSEGVEEIEGKINVENFENATVTQTDAGISIQTENGNVYSLNASGKTESLVISEDANGDKIATISNADGSSQRFVLDPTGNQIDGEFNETGDIDGKSFAYISGSGNVANVSDASVSLASGSSATIIGGADSVNVGSGASLSLTGDNNTLTLQNSSAVNLTGTGESVSGSGASVTLGANSSATFTGSGNTVNASQGDVIAENNAVINVAQGASVTITGTGDTIVAGGNNVISVTGGGDTVNLNGAGNTVVLAGNGNADTVNGDVAGDDVALAGGTTASVNGAGGAINIGAGDALTASGELVYSAPNAVGVTLNGFGDTVFAAAGFSANVAGGSDTVYLNGAGNTVVLSGNANTVNGDIAGDDVALTGNVSATVNGAGGAINIGAGDALTASGELVYAAPNAAGVTLNGFGDTVFAASGFSANVAGGSDTVYLNGAGNTVLLSGNANTVNGDIAGDDVALTGNVTATVNGAGGAINIGAGDTLTASGEQVYAAANAAGVTLNGSGDTVFAASGFSANVAGGSDTVYLNGAGNNVLLSGNANTVNGDVAGDDVALAGGATATVNGAGGAINIGAGDTLTASGELVYAAANAAGVTLNGSGDTVFAASGFSANVAGGSDTVYLNGAGNTVLLSGNANTVNGDVAGDDVALAGGATATVNGAGGAINIGADDTLTASGELVYAAPNAAGVTLNGFGDTVYAAAGFSANVAGGSDTVYLNGAGNNVLLSGNANVVNGDIAGDDVALAGNVSATVNGAGGAINIGAGDTLTASGEQVYPAANATGVTVNGAGDTVYAASGFSANVVGGGDTVYLNGAHDAVTLYGNNSQADIVRNDVTNDDVTLMGSMTAEVYGNSGRIDLHDSHETLTSNNESIFGGSNLTGEILNGVSNTITAGNGFTAEIAGANDSVIANNSHILLITGDSNDQIHGDNDIIAAQAQVTDSIFGHQDDFNGKVSDYNGEVDAGSTGSDGSPDWWTDGDGDGGPDPIVLNLDGGAVQTQALASSTAFFDMQNDGAKVHTGWVTPGEGLLVFDPDNSNTVTGDRDLVAGFDALNALAKEVDGASSDSLSASDALWAKLKVWVDPTGAGDFHSDQLFTLGQLGITSINLDAANVGRNSNGNSILADSSFTRSDGARGDIAGVALQFAPTPVASATLAAQSQQLISAMAGFAAPGGAALPMIAGNQNGPPITLAAGQR